MNKKRKLNICACNEVSEAEIQKVIQRGCKTLPKIFAATTAGIGQCGGSCRPCLELMLNEYLEKGSFPENPVKARRPRSKQKSQD